MILDGGWKQELRKLSREITFWRKMTFCEHIAEHRLDCAILYSSIVLRKIIEEEYEVAKDTRAKTLLPVTLKLPCAKVKVVQFAYVAEKAQTVRGRILADDYTKGEHITIELSKMCNQLIHSYIWSLTTSNKGFYDGFIVSSDKFREDYAYYVSFDEWLKVLKVANGNSIA